MSDSDKENDQHLNMLNDEIKHHKKMKRKEYNHKYYREKKSVIKINLFHLKT